MLVNVTTYYLEMLSPEQLRPKLPRRSDLEIKQAEIPCPELNRFLYAAVGGDWYWIDRLGWTYRQWLEYLGRPELQTWVAYVAGTPAGYFELEVQTHGDVEIVSFGLLPQFIGQGLGGQLLTAAVERAWATGASRVWVHTCSLDHPAALANYLARGFQVFRQDVTSKELPRQSPGPWPGARTGPGSPAD
ncbi:MAG: GNAT family N-acetyltransferase [Thermoguttaceae bacterium]